ncbi:MAG: septation protein SepH [Arachnia sp.]
MPSALTPREIQARLRAGASLPEVAAEAGVDEADIEGFATPVLAEREHIASTARAATLRRRGNGTGHRRLRDIVAERLLARGIDADELTWDAWRQPDLRWRISAELVNETAPRRAEFIFDPKGRFSVADNVDARWMIGEELPGVEGPDNENTVDFDDELALVRATRDDPAPPPVPGDDVPDHALYDDGPGSDELDSIYEMLSVVSEDSVRIYVGFEDETQDTAPEVSHAPQPDSSPASESPPAAEPDVGAAQAAVSPPEPAPSTPEAPPPIPEAEPPAADESAAESTQESLIGNAEPEKRSSPKKRRASIPSWDEILFGGPNS